MASNITPLAPVSATPLVREKRHFHGEHQQQNPQHSKQQKPSKPEDEQGTNAVHQAHNTMTTDAEKNTPNSVNPDDKHAKVRHLDEYV